MKHSLFAALILLLVINAVLLTLLYWFLLQQGFSAESYSLAAALLLPASLIAGYIIMADLAETKVRQDERLEHLVREALHEINLPLSTIDANTTMLERTAKDEKQKRRIERIKAASVRLKRLYERMAYGIRREFMPIEKVSFDLADMVRERIAWHEELGRNGFEVVLTPLTIEADRIGLEQAVDNLLENAIKYSDPTSSIEVILSDAKLSIRDYGQGMSATQLLHVYERYYQGNDMLQGEGIGLALVKRYCEEAGIGIVINSTESEGTSVVMDCKSIAS